MGLASVRWTRGWGVRGWRVVVQVGVAPAGLWSLCAGVEAGVGGWDRLEGRLADAVVGGHTAVRNDLTSF